MTFRGNARIFSTNFFLENLFRTEGVQVVYRRKGDIRIRLRRSVDVESYCATVTLSSDTVPSGQYAKYDSASSKTICSVDANLANQNEDCWTTIIGKHKKNDKKGKESKKKMIVSTAGMKV